MGQRGSNRRKLTKIAKFWSVVGVNGDIGHTRQFGATLARGDHVVDRIVVARKQGFDRSVAKISNPPSQPPAFGLADGPSAKEDALNAPSDVQPDGFSHDVAGFSRRA